MRSSSGTNFGLPRAVVACTNSTIAFLAGPSFQEGSGSVWALARAPAASSETQSAKISGRVLIRNVRPFEWRVDDCDTTAGVADLLCAAGRLGELLHHLVEAEARGLLPGRELLEALEPVGDIRLPG